MELVNRAAIAVSPRKPYLVWAGSLEGESRPTTLPPDDMTTVYLVNAGEKHFDASAFLRRHWATIFDEQLESWSRDPSEWPQKRTLAMFRKWFDIRVADMVFDLGQGTLDHDD